MSAALPIMTFDDVPLGPSLGYLFDPRWLGPYESIVSMLWKFAHMNGLAGSRVVSQLRAAPLDPYEGVPASPCSVDVRRVARMLHVAPGTVRCALGTASGRRALNPRLRHCPRCMGLKYHGMVHQFLGAMHCPVHGGWLEEACRFCGQATAYRLNALLLDAPYCCAHCRRPFGRPLASMTSPLPKRMRVAITRAYLR
jgi:hypothetical protein